MPPLADLDAVRRILQTDRVWSAFALADLTPGYREHARWYVPGDGQDAGLQAQDAGLQAQDTVVLLYHAFDPPLFVPLGAPERVEPVLAELAAEPAFYLSVQEPLLPSIEAAGYRLERKRLMHRMALDPARYDPRRSAACRPLNAADREAVETLYAEGNDRGEQPEFFLPAMLEIGVYEGVWEGGELVAAGGTHVFSPSEGVAALGNVYVRRDRRGAGLGAAVASAVIDRIRSAGVETIVLNVVAANRTAARLYERLGFRTYCDFIEAFAHKR